MTRPIRLASLAVLTCLLAGCSDDSKAPWKPPADSQVLQDGIVQFLGACQRDMDCASGRCIDLGGGKRCTQKCSAQSPCPALKGWSCTAAAFCECTLTRGTKAVCNSDNNCDAQPDYTPKAEVCNGEDDDCNTVIDDVAASTAGAMQLYRDADGDGYGDPQSSRWRCAPESGWVDKGGDCDDTNKAVNPGAVEICGDVVDENCNGQSEDAEVCGLTPVEVTDVTDPLAPSGTLKTCSPTTGITPGLDITEIVAKQDKTAIKFTVRLAGAPVQATCAAYTLQLGLDPLGNYDLTYVYRPAGALVCGASLPESAAYFKGVAFTSQLVIGFNAASPGHVSFTIPKAEFFQKMTTPTYHLKACTNATADAVKDITVCAQDFCATPVHR